MTENTQLRVHQFSSSLLAVLERKDCSWGTGREAGGAMEVRRR